MGFLSSLFGGTSKSSTTSETKLDPYWDKATKGLYSTAQKLGKEPYVGWTAAQKLAPLNDIDMAAIAAGAEIPFEYKKYLEQAAGAMGDYQQWPDADRAAYTNPYASDVSNRVLRDFQENYNQSLTAARARAPSLSALASPNQAIQEMLMEREYERGFGDLATKTRFAEYEDAYNKWAGDQERKRGAVDTYGKLAEASSNLGMQNLQMARDAGEYKRMMEDQRVRDWDYEEFLRKQEWPYKQVAFQKGIMQGMPMGQTTTSNTKNTTSGSLFSSLKDGLSSLVNAGTGLYKIFG